MLKRQEDAIREIAEQRDLLEVIDDLENFEEAVRDICHCSARKTPLTGFGTPCALFWMRRTRWRTDGHGTQSVILLMNASMMMIVVIGNKIL